MVTQKARWLPNVGEEFILKETPIPEPGPGEVLVKLEATAINLIDWKIQKEGLFLVKKYPATIMWRERIWCCYESRRWGH